MSLDQEEKNILDLYKKSKIETKHPTKKDLEEVKKIAKNTFWKNRRITIHLCEHDYKGIQKKAMKK